MGDNEALSRRGKLIRDLVAEFNQNDFLRSHFREGKRGESEFDRPYHYPDNLRATKISTDNFDMELLTPVEEKKDWVLLQLHGGGYVGPIKNQYRGMAKLYSDYGRGISVLTIDYRVAPENPFPAALEDALAAYDWLLDNGYIEEKIILGGDSAGGGLAMALCHLLKDKGRKLPAGIIAMSPWTDLTISGESYKKNCDIDPVFGNTQQNLLYENPYANEEEKSNPYVSPLFGDFEDFPPMLIQVGSAEMLMSDSVSVAEKAKASGVKVKLSVYEGMFHVFQMAGKLMPESAKAWAEIGRFMDVVMKRKSADTLRVALFERNIAWEDKEANFAELERILPMLEHRQIDLLLLPEMSMTGFSMHTNVTAEEGCETIEACGRLAQGYGINIGVGWVKKAEKLSENHYTIVSSEDGSSLLDYTKMHPFSYADEDEYFVGGDSIDVCNIRNMNIGSAICYDLRFPELFTRLAKKSELIVVPANWPAKRSLHWITLLRARAIETQCFIAGINCCGDMDGQCYSGDSVMFGPEGEQLTPFEVININDTDKIITYDVINNVDEVRKAFPVSSDRREELYGKL